MEVHLLDLEGRNRIKVSVNGRQTEVYEGLKAQGLKDVTITLYHGARHEVHNESMKEELFRDIIDYLDNHMPKAE